MQLDTTRRLEAGEAREAREARAQPIVQIEYLASYGGGMGVVDVSCANGCRCPPTSFDAHSPAEHAKPTDRRRHYFLHVPRTMY